MARREVIQYTDDLDGAPLDADGVEHRTFGHDGEALRLDLSAEHAAEFDKAMSVWVDKATKIGKFEVKDASARSRSAKKSAGATGPGTRTPEQNAAIREWAREKGYSVAARGQINHDILTAYDTASAAGTLGDPVEIPGATRIEGEDSVTSAATSAKSGTTEKASAAA